MTSDDHACTIRLSEIADLRNRLEIRADLLPADLALTGLLDDLIEVSTAAIELAEQSTRAVYPLVRTAFESAQRIVALATDDDYLRVGTRAWLYYQRKDAAVRRKTEAGEADRWLEAVVSRMRELWSPHNDEAAELLDSEAAALKEKKRPDNFMGRDLAEVVQERYQKIWPAGIPSEVKELNRGIYSALSRDSHARLRTQPAALTFQSNGMVRVISRSIDETARRSTLLHCLDASLTEAVGAVSYLLDSRREADARNQSLAERMIGYDLPQGFRPDLGLHLANSGATETTFHFVNVPIRKLGILPNGVASWSANIVLANVEYIVTFDVPAILLSDLAHAVGLSPINLTSNRQIVKEVFDDPRLVRVQSTLGERQTNGDEVFVPLVVKRVTTADVATPPPPGVVA